MLNLATDHHVLSKLGNHQDIFPSLIRGTEHDPNEPFDYSKFFEPHYASRLRFYHNDDETIGALFCWTSPDVWEMHIMATKEGRGEQVVDFGIVAKSEMFARWGAREVWAQTPVWNKAVRAYAVKIGATSAGFGIHPNFGEVELWQHRRADWESLRPKYEVQTSNSEVTS